MSGRVGVARLISLRGHRCALLDVLTWRVCKLAYPDEMARGPRWVRGPGPGGEVEP